MGTTLSSVLPINKGVVFLAILRFTMSDSNFNVITLEMYYGIKKIILIVVVFQQIL